jgi:hypothetical protein
MGENPYWFEDVPEEQRYWLDHPLKLRRDFMEELRRLKEG